MTYYFAKTLDASFDDALARTVDSLKSEGFGVLSDIDVQHALKAKIGVDFRRYRILGACNPALAHQALQTEDKIGTMLPCNVVVQEIQPGRVEVAAVDPIASMQGISNAALAGIAEQARASLKKVVDRL
ncbi:hypothetical protein C0Z18_26900 [Trinickia dabaoshanensis]|uniref:DUF302 domain-containing protein n=1 Tax=Trinickia dabaoshanensis TaxID=564714 RepID=A0A2N7VE95_9BURK|nr:DUF302 domain-containing protein [Trinickia dabaoshanensis]PMS15469.1 hypothetical protein C0Z18_26900 [Trinickia dabaoshanensis]